MRRIVTSRIDLPRVLKDGDAATVGIARRHADGWPVARLVLDYHPTLAPRVALRIEREATVRFRLSGASFVHRVGVVPAGDVIVVCAANAERWEGAMAAARWMLETAKHVLPVWKLEEGPRGRRWANGSVATKVEAKVTPP